VLLGLLRGRLAALLEARHHANQFSPVVDSPLGVLMSVLDGFLARFHGSPLVIVLAIGAAVLPFTTASQQIVLALVMLPPVASAAMAAWMVDDPASGKPGVNQHIRTGLTGMVQICVGYLIGIAMLSPLADVREWMVTESDATMTALDRHLYLTFVALGLSVAIGVVAGILSSRVEVLRIIFTFFGNIGRTIPSLAVLALALPIFGVGIQPSLVALVFIGTLPILVNTTVGIVEVSQDIKEAARGMGMNGLQVLLRVEIPVAAPVMMAGIRTSAVLVVASATLAAFIGGGGLGELIIRGQGSGQDQILFTGAILATILSILLEYLFGWLETIITPRGLRES
jgi:osmoprotectant transport system permease protein